MQKICGAHQLGKSLFVRGSGLRESDPDNFVNFSLDFRTEIF
jgi:hypothetical protein